MNLSDLRHFYARDLARLREEIGAYTSEEALWRVGGHILNSGANLSMHLVGNLNTYIGARLGQTGYVRDRPFEFAGKNIPQAKLIAQVNEVAVIVDRTLEALTPEELEKEYPEAYNGERVTTGYFLLHLALHLNYHLGQVNYHRRLLDV
ncbi:DinB family protein [Dinghuibacter silviterrae]|uniref:Uncharacterized protein DUF1572 n=1 Tax=Dinghuibacter silviterrae TaxID=1539049 RepID=A0A4R8DUK4_9BACT|nr:DinB family protein [Dinghuibacter silviterrae]TDX01616.1 uncharacterized protein DUF1572 [Dinghuibacter silviterrae]